MWVRQHWGLHKIYMMVSYVLKSKLAITIYLSFVHRRPYHNRLVLNLYCGFVMALNVSVVHVILSMNSLSMTMNFPCSSICCHFPCYCLNSLLYCYCCCYCRHHRRTHSSDHCSNYLTNCLCSFDWSTGSIVDWSLLR